MSTECLLKSWVPSDLKSTWLGSSGLTLNVVDLGLVVKLAKLRMLTSMFFVWLAARERLLSRNSGEVESMKWVSFMAFLALLVGLVVADDLDGISSDDRFSSESDSVQVLFSISVFDICKIKTRNMSFLDTEYLIFLM